MSAPLGRGGPVGVLLMTYGSPVSLDDVPRYLAAVRGREPTDELVAEFRRRYAIIGGSPLIEITKAQAAALESRLGGEMPVRAGMRFSSPTITDQLADLMRLGVTEVIATVMSPQFSELLMGGYARAIGAARVELGESAPDVALTGAWHLERSFLDALAGRIREALASFPPEDRDDVPVLLTAHSLPRRVAEHEPEYIDQLHATASAVAQGAGLDQDRWKFCWQSAGHEPGEWMKPDFADLMPELAAAGHRSVLVAPVQFLADHLEILYDVDVGAREQAEAAGLRFKRIDSLNVDGRFIDALASVATRELGLGRLGEEELELDRAVVGDRQHDRRARHRDAVIAEGQVGRTNHNDHPVDESGLQRDLDRLRDAVDGQRAAGRDVVGDALDGRSR